MSIYPTAEQIQTLLAGPADPPVVMPEIVRSAEVEAIGVHRAAGLESQWLIAATQGAI